MEYSNDAGDVDLKALANPNRRRVNRHKFVDGNYVFSYDKDSACGEKAFWRCERKGECPARIHTDLATGEVVKRLHFHTHPATPDPNFVHTTKRAKNSLRDALEGSSGLAYSHYDVKPSPLGGIFDADGDPALSALEGVTSQIMKSIDGVVKAESLDDEDVLPSGSTATVVVNPNLSATRKRLASSPQMFSESYSADVDESGEDYARVLELTKKVFSLVRKEASRRSTGPIFYHSAEMKRFVKMHHFTQFAPQLCKYSLGEMSHLSREECRIVIDDDAEGIRLYHAVQLSKAIREQSDGVGNSSEDRVSTGQHNNGQASGQGLTLLIADEKDEDQIYQMISFPDGETPTVDALRESLIKREVLTEKDNQTICFKDGKRTMVLYDEKFSSWIGEQTFTYRKNDKNLILTKEHE